MGRADQCHAFQRLDAALRLARLGGLGAEAVHKRLHMRNLALLFFIGGLLIGQLLRTADFKGGVVARVQC